MNKKELRLLVDIIKNKQSSFNSINDKEVSDLLKVHFGIKVDPNEIKKVTPFKKFISKKVITDNNGVPKLKKVIIYRSPFKV